MKNITNPLRALATTIMTKVIVNKPKPRKNLPKHLFLVLTALGALLPKDETGQNKTGDIAHSYTVKPKSLHA